MTRRAKFSDYRRELKNTKRWPIHFISVNWSNLPILGSGSIEFGSPFVILAGPNGSGKSKLLNAILAAIHPSHADAPELDDIGSGTISVVLSVNGDPVIYSYDFNRRLHSSFFDPATTESIDIQVEKLEVPDLVLYNRSSLRHLGSREIITNGASDYTLSDSDLLDVKFITQKDYTSVTRYITDEGLHYFEVQIYGASYSSLSMGLGELTSLIIWSSIKESENKELIALEEPEAFLSPGSRQALSNFLLEKTVKTRINFLISTHSYDIAASAQSNGLVPIRLSVDGIKTCSVMEIPEVMEMIGHHYRETRVIFVEDALAEAFLFQMIATERPSVSRSAIIRGMTGFGDLVNLGKVLPSSVSSLNFFLFPDTDKFGSKDISHIPDNMVGFIPTDSSIEKEFLSVMNDNILSVKTIFSPFPLESFLRRHAGHDDHDVINAICDSMPISRKELCRIVYPYWRERYWNEGIERRFVEIHKRLYPAE